MEPALSSLKTLSASDKQLFSRAGISKPSEIWLQTPHELAKKLRVGVDEVQKAIRTLCLEIAPKPTVVNKKLFHESYCFTTGDALLDEKLGGGIHVGSITEISGESGSGKTQIALQIALMAQLDMEDNGLNSGVAYFSTTTSLPVVRLSELARTHPKCREYNRQSLTDNVHHCPVPTVPAVLSGLTTALDQLFLRVEDSSGALKPIKLVILDSIGSIFHSVDRTTTTTLVERSRAVNEISQRLHHVASTKQVAVVVINQVSDVFNTPGDAADSDDFELLYKSQSEWFSRSPFVSGHIKQEATLGLIFANQINTRIMLARTRRRIRSSEDEERRVTKKRKIQQPNNRLFAIMEGILSEEEEHTSDSGTMIRTLSILFSNSCSPCSLDFVIKRQGLEALQVKTMTTRSNIYPVSKPPPPLPPVQESGPSKIPSTQGFISARLTQINETDNIEGEKENTKRQEGGDLDEDFGTFDEEAWANHTLDATSSDEHWDIPESEGQSPAPLEDAVDPEAEELVEMVNILDYSMSSPETQRPSVLAEVRPSIQSDLDNAFSAGEESDGEQFDLKSSTAAFRERLAQQEKDFESASQEEYEIDITTPNWSAHSAVRRNADVEAEEEDRRHSQPVSPFAVAENEITISISPSSRPHTAPLNGTMRRDSPDDEPTLPSLEAGADENAPNTPVQTFEEVSLEEGAATPASARSAVSQETRSPRPPSVQGRRNSTGDISAQKSPNWPPPEALAASSPAFQARFKASKHTGQSTLQKVISKTRPVYLPPKSREEDIKHQKVWEKMMKQSREAEEKRAEELQQRRRERENAVEASIPRWQKEVLPDWKVAMKDPSLRHMWWQGIPTKMRSQLWEKAIGNSLQMSKESYRTCLGRAKRAIQRGTFPEDAITSMEEDMDTTLPSLHLFHRETGAMREDLRDLMLAWTVARSDEGLGYHHISPAEYLSDWLIPIFIDHLPFETCARLWDILVLEGDSFLFRTALAIFGVLESRLFFPDRLELIQVLRGESRAAVHIAMRTAAVSEIVDLGARYEVYGLNEESLWDRIESSEEWWKESTWLRLIQRELPDM
ncbi:14299_t:CDS:2 [Acaulospora colombiana]|uniref:14299_t:CDS:1 n=1 Tax=Acaulospora colombiana TaxID=27376 RepID=A0ACA9MMP2_9GLOM|nr:14299_t:CDS:2 [Acaulospora colombiana]